MQNTRTLGFFLGLTGWCGAQVLLAQEPPAARPPRVGFQAEGIAVFLQETPPTPLFTSALGQSPEGSLEETLGNYALGGLLGLLAGSPRPVSTMVDLDRYCELAGVRCDLDALCALVEGSSKPLTASGRASLDRLAALTLLGQQGGDRARAAIAAVTKSDDAVLGWWAKQQADYTANKAPSWNLPIDGLTATLATVPSDTGLVVFIDNTNAPRWRNLWRISADLRRSTSDRVLAAGFGNDERLQKMQAWSGRVHARCDLLAYELARRYGNACFVRTLLAVPGFTRERSFMSWWRFDGMIAQDAIAAGLRADGANVANKDGVVVARFAEGLAVRATATSLTVEADPDAARLPAEQAHALAQTLAGPNVALAIEFVKRDLFAEMPLPEAAKPILTTLRRIVLRHEPGTTPKVRLELHYADKKTATVAGAALGALLTMAKAQSDKVPATVRDALREFQVSTDGAVASIEAELDASLATVIEDCLTLMAR